MEEINIFKDYEAFIKENNNLISTLIKNNSKAISRFVPVIKVVEYLYNQHYFKQLSEDEMTFFSMYNLFGRCITSEYCVKGGLSND